MNFYQFASTLLALCLYVPLGRRILKGSAAQNLATWILWGLLDVVAGVSLYAQGGNWYLLGAYVTGCTAIVLCLLRKGEWTWGLLETTSTAMVVVSLVAWYYSGPRNATIISTAGVALATIPQWKDAWKDPWVMPLDIYAGFTMANVLATVGGSAWTVGERLYPATCIVLCFVIFLLTLRRFTQKTAAAAQQV